jgi:hypothetical protein
MKEPANHVDARLLSSMSNVLAATARIVRRIKSMRAHHKRWGLLLAVLAGLFLVILVGSKQAPTTSTAVMLTFIGYTNTPGSPTRFALFSASNQAPYAVRWRGLHVDVEGEDNRKAPTINLNLPGPPREPVFKPGASLRIAIGEPVHVSESGRWRLVMTHSRHTWQSRCVDFSWRHKLPLRLGPIVLLNDQRIVDPSNHVAATSDWLRK